MQEGILRLTRYWTDRGCVLGQPLNTEVGAGTLNPATYLRVLGPEPWRTVYVEPSVRPDDSRYGDNPNRMQTHTQLQVILKPDPANAQELYLGSLAAIGIDTKKHDVRFVEDNWESPALGAWGLGWEVWLDGLEITQFTYFQQAGGLVLDPVSVEITYGIERILMAVQGVTHFKDVRYSDDVSYGEIVGQVEREMSVYYLDQADVEVIRQTFELSEREAERLIQERLPIPAHQYVLKCSHAFNVLDSRGAVGTTERARSFRRMRKLAHDVAELWIERRAELEHPLGLAAVREAPPVAETPPAPASDEPSTFVLELGFEELPPDEVTSFTEQLGQSVEETLATHRIAHGEVAAFGSPRRIIVRVDEVAPRQPDRSRRVRGPRFDAAFAPDGSPTRAAEGFARKHGVSPSELEREEDGDSVYVAITVHETGRSAADVLSEVLPGVVSSLAARRAMRWSAGSRFASSRAMRWIVALLGPAVVPFTYADMASGRRTRTLRDADEPEIDVASADDLLSTLRANTIEYDGARRCERIFQDAQRLAAEAGGAVDLDVDGSVLDEVTNLVENPLVLIGSFGEEYLRLPAEVLTVVMKKHQRYFPVRDRDGRLLPRFVSVANGPVDGDVVRAGNEAVLRARYADAAFFYDRDLARPLESYRPELAKLIFEEKAGTMLDRSDRIERLATTIASELSLDAGETATLERAAHLAKADLATNLVVELSSLAGQMGRVYALASGETPAVADAIFEAALPRFAGDDLPTSRVGAILSVADRADALVTLFAAGAKPTGSADPYALRRAATGLAQVIVLHSLPLGLDSLFQSAARGIHLPVTDELLADLREFVERRLEVRLVDEGHRVELVRALRPQWDRPADVASSLAVLEDLFGSDGGFSDIANAYRRTSRISVGVSAGPVDENRFVEPAEASLWAAFEPLEDQLRTSALDEFAKGFRSLVAPLDAFFTDVMVMADDPAVRENRLALLARIRDSGAHLLDWDALPEADAGVTVEG